MSERRRPVDRPRRAALDVLTAVRVDEAYANLVLPQVLRMHGLDGRDAALATELASGAIRMQGLYDPIIDASLTKPKLQAGVRDVLRLGAHQLLSMRVPDHAAISTSVDLVRGSVGQGPAGLVNAVLRKISRRTLADWVEEVAPDRSADLHGHLAVAHSHPRWVVDALGEALGRRRRPRGPARRRQRAPAGDARRPPRARGRRRAGGCGRHAHRSVAVRRRAGGWRPGGHPRRGRGPRRACRTRAPRSWRWR